MIEQRNFPAVENGSLRMGVPKHWREQMVLSGGPPTIAFRVSTGNYPAVVVSFIPIPPKTTAPTPDVIRRDIERAASLAAKDSKNKTAPVTDLVGEAGRGSYLTIAFENPSKHGYGNLAQGLYVLNEVLLQFSIQTNDGDEQIRETAFAMLRGAKVVPK